MAYTLNEVIKAFKINSSIKTKDIMETLRIAQEAKDVLIENEQITFPNLDLNYIFDHALDSLKCDDGESVCGSFEVSHWPRSESDQEAIYEEIWLEGWDKLVGYNTKILGDWIIGVKYPTLRDMWCKTNNKTHDEFENEVKTIFGSYYQKFKDILLVIEKSG